MRRGQQRNTSEKGAEDEPKGNHELIPLQHAKVEHTVAILDISDPYSTVRPSTPARSTSTSTSTPSALLPSLRCAPDVFHRFVPSLQRHALHCDSTLVFGPSGAEVARLEVEGAAESAEGVVHFLVGLLQSEVDVIRCRPAFCYHLSLSLGC